MKAILIEFKLYFILAAIAALLGGMALFGAHERGIGAAKVQAKWDLATAKQNVVTVEASEKARVTEQKQVTSFTGIEAGYLQATTHEPTPFDLPAALAAGTLKLRNDCTAPDPRRVSRAASRSRELDAAATEAISKRVEAASTVVRVGHASDARERQLSAQVTALQSLLNAERATSPP